MLPSTKRLTTPLFKEVMDKGKLFHGALSSAKFLKTTGASRFSVAVSKKVAKNATDRNKVRRRIYNVLRKIYINVPTGIHGVFMAKNTILKAKLPAIALDMKSIFVKSGLLT